MMKMYRSKRVGVTQATNDYLLFCSSFLDQLQYNYFDMECTVHFVNFIICVQQINNIFMYVPCIFFIVFISNNYVEYVYYFNDIHIIITPNCFDTFLSSSTT